MQIGGKVIANLIVDMVLEKKKKHKFKKTKFHASLFENGLNRFHFETIIQLMTMTYGT